MEDHPQSTHGGGRGKLHILIRPTWKTTRMSELPSQQDSLQSPAGPCALREMPADECRLYRAESPSGPAERREEVSFSGLEPMKAQALTSRDSKRKGLEKAIHQIEQAIKRPKIDESGPGDAQKAISDLQELLARFQGQLQSDADGSSDGSGRLRNLPSPREASADESLALDDAENPLQLLARASDLQLSPTGLRHAPNSPLPPVLAPSILPQEPNDIGQLSAKSFFVPARANRDVGPELDPVVLGLVTFDESESLFSL